MALKLNKFQKENIGLFFFTLVGFFLSSFCYDFIKTFITEYMKIDENNIRDKFFIVFLLFILVLFLILNLNQKINN